MKEQQFIYFDQYISDEMTAEERKSFEGKLKNDPVFANEFQKFSALIKELRTSEVGRSEIDSSFEEEEKLIFAYLNNDLSDTERVSFEQKLDENPLLQKRVTENKAILSVLEEDTDPSLQAWVEQNTEKLKKEGFFEEANVTPHKKAAPRIRRLKPRRFLYALVSLAASVAILIFSGIIPFFSNDTTYDFVAANWTDSVVEYVTRPGETDPDAQGFGPENTQERSLRKALHIIRDGNLSKGKLELETHLEKYANDPDAEVALALVLLMSDETETATVEHSIQTLEELENDYPENEELFWTLTLCKLVHKSNQKEGLQRLDAIIKNGGEYSGKAAEVKDWFNSQK